MRRLLATATIVLLCCRSAHGSDIETLVPWLLQQERQLENVSFSQVLELATGHKLLPADAPQFQPLIRSIADTADQVVKQMNTPESPATSARRVNEMSRFFEDALQQALDAADNLECRFPPTADGAIQRSGYPDLQITDKTSGAVCYLDIKLHAADSRGSTFRTF